MSKTIIVFFNSKLNKTCKVKTAKIKKRQFLKLTDSHKMQIIFDRFTKKQKAEFKKIPLFTKRERLEWHQTFFHYHPNLEEINKQNEKWKKYFDGITEEQRKSLKSFLNF